MFGGCCVRRPSWQGGSFTQVSFVSDSANIEKPMINPLKQVASNRTGLWLAMIAVLSVVGWRLCIIARQPAHWLAIATELGSVGHIETMHPSRDNTSLLYDQETETGIGTFFFGMASGQSKLLFEQTEKNHSDWRTRTLGWSPDDSLVACAVPANLGPGMPAEEIILYGGHDGDAIARIPADGYDWYSQFTWLSPQSFAYSSAGQSLAVFERQSNGTWAEAHLYEQRIAGEGWRGLTARSPQSVAWQEDRAVWMFDFASSASSKIWESPTNTTLESFSVTETGNLLLRCSDENGPLSILFTPSKGNWDPKGTVVSITRNDNGERHADLSMDYGLYTFTIENSANSAPTRFVWEGMAENYTLVGDDLYFIGNRASGLPGIWQYDINSKAVRCLVPGVKGDLKYTKIVAPLLGICTNTSGKQISYHLWEPVNVSPGKKYPLILGQGHYVWSSYPQIAALEGYYFATVDRTTWADNIDNWPVDVLGLYETLVKHPNIDTKRVFLYAFSAEAGDVVQVLNVKPDLCQGVILVVPSAMPDLSNAHLSKTFIVGGMDDDIIKPEWYTNNQDAAARVGIPVRLVLQNGSRHLPRSVATERERARQLARFLLEN
jgi:hypothetical protein